MRKIHKKYEVNAHILNKSENAIYFAFGENGRKAFLF